MQKGRQEKERDNLEAQLLKLRANTARAVQQIHDVVELKEGYLLEIKNLDNELSDKKSQLNQAVLSVEKLNVERDSLLTDISDLDIQKTNLLEFIDREKNKAEGEINSRQSLIANLDNQAMQKKEQHYRHMESLEKETEAKLKEKQEVEEGISGAKVVLEDIKDQIEDGLAIIDDAHTYAEHVTQQANDKIGGIQAREENLIKKDESLKLRAKLLDQREADLKVYERRVIRAYEQTFPGRKAVL